MEGKLKSILITDCGTSTTSAVLIEQIDGTYRMTSRGEASTTVDPPISDVTVGVQTAVRQIETSTGKKLLQPDGAGIITPWASDTEGVDLYLSTSSTGGGLQMMVAGLVRIMTAESAERAALGAGAMVMDVISIDDGRMPHEKIQRIRELNPDMILLSGGIDDGNYEYVLELAEHIKTAKLQEDLPIIYAGNVAAQDRIGQILSGKARLFYVDNVRPVLEKEVLEPAGREIHRRFMEHVVARAPGYSKLAKWSDHSILPSTAAIGYMIEAVAKEEREDILGLNLGEATTDVFSSFGDRFTRTVSGDLGVGSSLSNALLEAGISNVLRWLPFEMGELELRNHLRNLSLRPYSPPVTEQELMVEHAVAREIIRLSIEQHKASVVGLRGVRRERDISNVFDQKGSQETLFDPMSLSLVIGSGTPFRLATRHSQILAVMLDAIQPRGVTQFAVDEHFTAPHLGMLSTLNRAGALDVFMQDGLLHLGAAINPLGDGNPGESCVAVKLSGGNGVEHSQTYSYGELHHLALPEGQYNAQITPASGFDVGMGKGKPRSCKIVSGICGIVIDTRDLKALNSPQVSPGRRKQMLLWLNELDAYPEVKGVWGK